MPEPSFISLNNRFPVPEEAIPSKQGSALGSIPGVGGQV